MISCCKDSFFKFKNLLPMNKLGVHYHPQFSRVFFGLIRCITTRRVPSDPSYINEIPIFQYPKWKKSDRRIYAWGVAETGALGHYNLKRRRQMKTLAEYQNRPLRLTFGELEKVKDVSCGYGFTAFSIEPKKGTSHIQVFGCGVNTDSQIGYHAPRRNAPMDMLLNPAPIDIPFQHHSTRVTGLAAGRAHLLILTDNEGVFSLGNNAYGQCGRPVIDNENYVGSRLVHSIKEIDGQNIRSIACGQDHSMFITESGETFACGWAADGQTGQKHFESHWNISRVCGDIQGENIIKVSSAADCVLAINSNGDVFGWGNSEYGQLGTDVVQLNIAKHLTVCKSLGKIVDVAAGGSFCMALNEDGQVFVWGYGILGKGPVVERSLQPTEIPVTLFGRNEFQPDTKVIGVNCGLNYLVANTSSGDLYSWGHNRGGCLGLGHNEDQYFPFKVSLGASVVKVSCGVDHTMALCVAH